MLRFDGGLPNCHACDVRSDYRKRHAKMLDANIGKAGGFDCFPRFAIWTAAIGKERRERRDPLLPKTRSRIFGGGDMFEKNECSTGLQDAPNFCERTSDVLNRAKHKRTYDRIHAAVSEIEMAGISFAQFRVEPRFARRALEIRMHVWIRLYADPAHSARVVRQIRTGARADLDNRSRQAAKKFALATRDCPLVARGAIRHQPSKYAFAEASTRTVRFSYHGCLPKSARSRMIRSSWKLAQEANVILEKRLQIRDPVAEHGQAIHAHSERESR